MNAVSVCQMPQCRLAWRSRSMLAAIGSVSISAYWRVDQRRRLLSSFAVLIGVLIHFPIEGAFAQHPIEVQRKAAQGDYYQALLTYEKMPKRKVTTEAIISAAKSAWALGLAERAIDEFDRALTDQTLDQATRAKLYLSRGIIDFQEQRLEVAVLYAKRALELLNDPSPLRARAWLLWAQALAEQGEYGAAAQQYSKALEEADPALHSEIHYLIGVAYFRLGQRSDAQMHFEQIPVDHERTPEALRYLAEIAMQDGNYPTAAFWLKKGKREFPDRFLDSWVDYALLQVAISKKDQQAVEVIRSEAEKKYPPSDFWLNLMNAAAESFAWQKLN